jgi:Tripartite tricarboxylate transporter TctB family
MAETRPDENNQGAWARPVSTRTGGAVMAVALLACAAFFVGLAALLPFGDIGLPGPAFFPFALGIALGILALLILFQTLRRADDGDETFVGHRNVLVATAALMLVALAFEHADTYLLLGTFAAVLLVLVARVSPWRALLGALLGMVAVWALFARALGVRLPTAEFWSEIASGLSSAPL